MYSDCKYVSEAEFDELDKRCNPRYGDVVITKSGSIGDCAILDAKFPVAFFESLALVKLKDVVNAIFFKFFFRNQSVHNKYIKGKAKGIAIKHLHLIDLKSVDVILPPLSLQQTFAAKIESIEKQKAAISKSIAETEKLFEYTMDKYFG